MDHYSTPPSQLPYRLPRSVQWKKTPLSRPISLFQDTMVSRTCSNSPAMPQLQLRNPTPALEFRGGPKRTLVCPSVSAGPPGPSLGTGQTHDAPTRSGRCQRLPAPNAFGLGVRKSWPVKLNGPGLQVLTHPRMNPNEFWIVLQSPPTKK